MKFGVRDEDEYEVENEDEDEDEDEPRYVRIRAFDSQRYHAFRKIYASVGPRLVPGEWLKGREAILPEPEEFEEIDYSPKRRLRKMFKEHGLQVIVKMASIELTPEKPHFPTGSWHVSRLFLLRLLSAAGVMNIKT